MHYDTERTRVHYDIERTRVHCNIEKTRVHYDIERTRVHCDIERTRVHYDTERTRVHYVIDVLQEKEKLTSEIVLIGLWQTKDDVEQQLMKLKSETKKRRH